MSKRKHNISYIKPDEPKFLQQLKAQIGYKEGPSVDTKREDLPTATEEDLEDRADELPTVVVLDNGDLTAKEAADFECQKAKEDAERPADLSERIIFTKVKSTVPKTNVEKSSTKNRKKTKRAKVVVSFDEDEEN